MTERGGEATHACHRGCVIQCSGIYNDENGKYLTSRPNTKPSGRTAALRHRRPRHHRQQLDRLDDDLGLDTIEMGVADRRGDGRRAAAVRRLRGRHPRSSRKSARAPRSAVSSAPVPGSPARPSASRGPGGQNQACPAYDPRAVQGIGVTYATTPMGADHTAGYAVAANMLKVGGIVDPLKTEGQVELSRNLQIDHGRIDSSGMCLFVAFPLLDQPETFTAFVELVNSFYGIEADVTALASRSCWPSVTSMPAPGSRRSTIACRASSRRSHSPPMTSPST